MGTEAVIAQTGGDAIVIGGVLLGLAALCVAVMVCAVFYAGIRCLRGRCPR